MVSALTIRQIDCCFDMGLLTSIRDKVHRIRTIWTIFLPRNIPVASLSPLELYSADSFRVLAARRLIFMIYRGIDARTARKLTKTRLLSRFDSVRQNMILFVARSGSQFTPISDILLEKLKESVRHILLRIRPDGFL